MTFVKKSTPVTESVTGAAAASIKDSVSKLTIGLEEVKKLPELLDNLGLQIAAKEDKLKELDVTFAEKQRQHSVEFGLKVKEDSGKVVAEILASQHLVAMPKAELDGLHTKLKTLETDFDKEVNLKINAATGAMSREFKHKEELLLSQQRTEQAENLGKIASLGSKVEVLTEQLTIAQNQLTAERAAGVERAKAGSIGNINIGESTGKQR